MTIIIIIIIIIIIKRGSITAISDLKNVLMGMWIENHSFF